MNSMPFSDAEPAVDVPILYNASAYVADSVSGAAYGDVRSSIWILPDPVALTVPPNLPVCRPCLLFVNQVCTLLNNTLSTCTLRDCVLPTDIPKMQFATVVSLSALKSRFIRALSRSKSAI